MKALLKPNECQFGDCGLATRQFGNPRHSKLTISAKLTGQFQLRCAFRQAVENDRLDNPLGESLSETAQIGFQTANHRWFQVFRTNFNTPREALRVKHFEQC